jgi:hypothetical protein
MKHTAIIKPEFSSKPLFTTKKYKQVVNQN